MLRLPNISPHVLVLDDDLDALEEIQEILELDDLICVTASNTNDARQALSNDPCISAIVTDVHLRGSDETGLDFIAGLGDELADREMTFIVLSGDPSAIVPSIQTGAVDFLTKPLVPEDLLRAIRSRMKADIADVLFRKVEETTKSLQQAHINLAEAELSLSESNDAYERRRIMGGKLRQGLKDGHILPWFQPQICIETGVILGFEALVRWDDPVRGLQNPAEFLPLAHEIGLIIELDHAVQKQAFETLRKFHQSGLVGCDIGINLTAAQLRSPDLAGTLTAQINAAGLAPEYVSVEVLESAMLDDDAGLPIKSNIQKVHDLGVGIELDDFGTGHAGLSSLRDLAVSRIKIDRSFVTDIHQNAKLQNFTRALIGLANTLGVGVLAEGVETQEELMWLKAEGCHAVQGFYIAKPMPSAAAFEWAQRWQATDGINALVA